MSSDFRNFISSELTSINTRLLAIEREIAVKQVIDTLDENENKFEDILQRSGHAKYLPDSKGRVTVMSQEKIDLQLQSQINALHGAVLDLASREDDLITEMMDITKEVHENVDVVDHMFEEQQALGAEGDAVEYVKNVRDKVKFTLDKLNSHLDTASSNVRTATELLSWVPGVGELVNDIGDISQRVIGYVKYMSDKASGVDDILQHAQDIASHVEQARKALEVPIQLITNLISADDVTVDDANALIEYEPDLTTGIQYSTGLVSGTGSTITGSGTTFTSAMAPAILVIPSLTLTLNVNGFTSATILTIEGTTAPFVNLAYVLYYHVLDANPVRVNVSHELSTHMSEALDMSSRLEVMRPTATLIYTPLLNSSLSQSFIDLINKLPERLKSGLVNKPVMLSHAILLIDYPVNDLQKYQIAISVGDVERVSDYAKRTIQSLVDRGFSLLRDPVSAIRGVYNQVFSGGLLQWEHILFNRVNPQSPWTISTIQNHAGEIYSTSRITSATRNIQAQKPVVLGHAAMLQMLHCFKSRLTSLNVPYDLFTFNCQVMSLFCMNAACGAKLDQSIFFLSEKSASAVRVLDTSCRAMITAKHIFGDSAARLWEDRRPQDVSIKSFISPHVVPVVLPAGQHLIGKGTISHKAIDAGVYTAARTIHANFSAVTPKFISSPTGAGSRSDVMLKHLSAPFTPSTVAGEGTSNLSLPAIERQITDRMTNITADIRDGNLTSAAAIAFQRIILYATGDPIQAITGFDTDAWLLGKIGLRTGGEDESLAQIENVY